MRPEGASILSARCEIREIPLTVTSKTDSVQQCRVSTFTFVVVVLCRPQLSARESCWARLDVS